MKSSTSRRDHPIAAPSTWFTPRGLEGRTPNSILDHFEPVVVAIDPDTRKIEALAKDGRITLSPTRPAPESRLIRAFLPGLFPEDLGDAEFRQQHGLRYAYIGGAMARGISSADMVVELARMGGFGFFGAAGLSLPDIETNVIRLKNELGPSGLPWGANLIHSPAAPGLEEEVVDLFLKHDVTRISASAFMSMSPSIVRCASIGMTRDSSGRVTRRNHVFAKISRPEVARHFMVPPPEAMLVQLVAEGKLTQAEADCASTLPVASAITVESDSGGHTDNRPLGCLFGRILAERDEISTRFPAAGHLPVGAAGGLGTPEALASAFALGAAFVLIGSVHQATVEAGISAGARKMLAQADFTDIGMTASADMFEAGVKVQVLTRGTMMAHRGNLLYKLYQSHRSLDELSTADREELERNVFRAPLEQVWAETRERALRRNPAKVAEAESDPRLKMAMVFRSYLGRSSRWPISGDNKWQTDYQIWCGPAMGSFNRWTKGTFLDSPENRTVRQVALNLMAGAARWTRIQELRNLGVSRAHGLEKYQPQHFK